MYPGWLVAASPPIFNLCKPMERTEMSNDQPTVKPAPQPISNVAFISGRVDSVRRTDDYYYTVITLPAPDEFSNPSVVEVRSAKSIGRKGEDVKLPVQCAGFRGKPFKYKDNETGEIIQRRPVNNAFIAIEQ